MANLYLFPIGVEGLLPKPAEALGGALRLVAFSTGGNAICGEVFPSFAAGQNVVNGDRAVINRRLVAVRAAVAPSGLNRSTPKPFGFCACHGV